MNESTDAEQAGSRSFADRITFLGDSLRKNIATFRQRRLGGHRSTLSTTDIPDRRFLGDLESEAQHRFRPP
ncbi:hypothetical protein [Paraburkholderia hiiakae]|uniref:hypothetical protein n=1 Tax=Paraburkholderia hiiakae TaxID=1081782 RepID=UPI00191B3980|nr:hypothetical protein [Paraburkholderia hiiakae]